MLTFLMDNKHKDPSIQSANPLSDGLDRLSTDEIVTLMHRQDIAMMDSLTAALPSIARAATHAAKAISDGGKVVYVGAGTSGRLAVLDASEIMPTFGSGAFRGIIAGGDIALTQAVEGAEDDTDAGHALAMQSLNPGDMAVGVTASGTTPFVLGLMQGARKVGAICWMLICSEITPSVELDGLITMPTGAEIISGSTRLKAGTATKMALNMLSTATMIKLGGSYDGLMVDVVPANAKLVSRAESIIMEITRCSATDAADALRAAGMSAKTASLMIKLNVDRAEAEGLLSENGGSLRDALESKG